MRNKRKHTLTLALPKISLIMLAACCTLSGRPIIESRRSGDVPSSVKKHDKNK